MKIPCPLYESITDDTNSFRYLSVQIENYKCFPNEWKPLFLFLIENFLKHKEATERIQELEAELHEKELSRENAWSEVAALTGENNQLYYENEKLKKALNLLKNAFEGYNNE